jgi:hypothetical protein
MSKGLPVEIDFSGRVFEQCTIDFAFSLHLVKDRDDLQIRIEAPFVCVIDGINHTFDSTRHPEALGPALALLHRTVQAASLEEDGRLRMEFANGAQVILPSDGEFESWQLSTESGWLIVAGPEGRVSIFSPR